MNGSVKMEIKQVTIDVLDPASIRSLASQLLKANNDGKYMVFIQKIDTDVSVYVGYCSVDLRARGRIP